MQKQPSIKIFISATSGKAVTVCSQPQTVLPCTPTPHTLGCAATVKTTVNGKELTKVFQITAAQLQVTANDCQVVYDAQPHGITVTADVTEAALPGRLARASLEAVILPGGMPGTTNLDASPVVEKTLELAAAKGSYLCAICAAPLVLGKRGYLNGKRATCFPGFEEYLTGATVGGKVIRDGRIITAAGMGVAQEFGFEIISALVSPEKAGEIREAIQSL